MIVPIIIVFCLRELLNTHYIAKIIPTHSAYTLVYTVHKFKYTYDGFYNGVKFKLN